MYLWIYPLQHEILDFKKDLGQMQLQNLKKIRSADGSNTLLMKLECTCCGSFFSGKYCLLLHPFGNTTSDQCKVICIKSS